MRILLFLATNFAILLVAGTVLSLLGFDGFMAANGVDLNLSALLVFCAVFGFGGSLISLFLSKWMAKRGTGTYIIEQPRNQHDEWLLSTVKSLADEAGIGMPEVGIFPSQTSNAFATGWNRNNALVAVSAGLLERFPREEVRAILAHEIGHVANGDMVTLTLIQGVLNTFVLFFCMIDYGLLKPWCVLRPHNSILYTRYLCHNILPIVGYPLISRRLPSIFS